MKNKEFLNDIVLCVRNKKTCHFSIIFWEAFPGNVGNYGENIGDEQGGKFNGFW